MKTIVLVCIALAMLLVDPTPETGLHAQQMEVAAPRAASYEGQKVSSVLLAGQPDGDLNKLRSLVQQKINAPYPRRTPLQARRRSWEQNHCWHRR
jgi:hypothetical protein